MGGMAAYVVARVPLVIALPADHRIAAKGSLALSTLKTGHFAMVPRDVAPGFRDQFCFNAGFIPDIRHRARHFLGLTWVDVLTCPASGALARPLTTR